jgi:ABC-2 type transport system permease protein
VNVRAFTHMAVAQARILWRNVTFWLISIFIAVLSMLVFGLLFKPESQPFDLAFVDEDRSEASASLSGAFAALDNADFRTGERDPELDALRDGDRGAVVIVPEGFGESVADGDAALEVYYDNSNPIRIGYVTATIDAVVQAYNEQLAGKRDAVRVSLQAIDTRTVRYVDFLVPGMVGMTIMFTNLAVGFLMVNWRELGILRRLGVTPLRPGVLISSQAASFAMVSIAQVSLILIVARFAFNVTIEGSVIWLAVTGVAGVLCMLSLGYTIASFARTVQSFNAFQQLLAFPMLFLGKSYFPIDPSPALQPVVEAVPLTHLNDALREIINRGGGPGDLWADWFVLVGWALAGFIISIRVFRWQ